ncbi:TetR/AcrR family transcriptional regulator [Pseudomaricurvus alkylphenolicus]|uniref:TetR/AcrR family transcriptional regulator n=1 Tax=Pseudomaricurvus alkylphenolicus TaxID=1306991 RepID=UPI0014217B61|nr:TetR/AcrR family transcriptional regulator [Pseudomaricurvus alkylphenolicus]NIB43591.1 TetR/AcrR family transcriptional regulator [Pseudomaricurvus alkylphenolicus]
MQTLSASDLSKQRLILAALKLFAEQGIDAVSLRMINREAGAKNNSALHYHFGSKTGLVEAVVEFVQDWFEEAREEALKSVEGQKKPKVRDILRALVTPYLKLLKEEAWGYHAVRFIARMEMEGGPEIHDILNRFASKAMKRFTKLFSTALPDVPRKLLKQRLNFCITSIIKGMADYKSLKNSYMGDVSCSLDKLGEMYIEYNAAGLAASVK